MKTVFPCKITHSAKDDCWYVEAPGFYTGIMTYGNSLEHAKKMAAEAVAGLLESRIDHDLPFDIPVFREKKDYYAIPLEPNLSFALWLRFQRKAHKMTLADAAEKMGVKYQVYQKLENPRTANPTLKTLSRIERVFNTELVTI